MLPGLATLLLAASPHGASPEIRYGPPASPLSWSVVETLKPGATGVFTPPDRVLGVSQTPARIERAEFQDERPYGEAKQRSIWLVRYESVPIREPGGAQSALVPLSVAFDAVTGNPVCAFTDPAPVWAHGVWDPKIAVTWETTTRLWGEAPAPAQYATLQATLTEVLEALWKQTGIAPDRAGQIILRPRFFTNTWPKKEINGPPVYPPANRWIVEVLGRYIQEALGQPLTTLVVCFLDVDGQLTWLESSPRP
jgi:hypothetical protein